MNLQNYQTIVFDCDGVILNSNKVKTEAFYYAALPYGKDAAKSLVEFHIARGGISRYKKFEWFFDEVVKSNKGPSLEELLEVYAQSVRQGLMNCDVADGLADLREMTKNANWLIVSGGDQAELREIFALRNLDELFDGGIFGSPDSKDLILAREIRNGNIKSRALFVGDSKYDYASSSNAGLDFIFVSKWSEISFWEEWVQSNNLKFVDSLSCLVR